MICPACSEDIVPIGTDIAPPLGICPACERSLVLSDGSGARLAMSTDTSTLNADTLASLRKLRTQTADERRAYYAAHH